MGLISARWAGIGASILASASQALQSLPAGSPVKGTYPEMVEGPQIPEIPGLDDRPGFPDMDDGSMIARWLAAYWYLPVFLGILLMAAGVAAGLAREPTYTATSTLSVGTSSIGTANELGGYAASGPTLAAAYSRAVDATDVLNPVADKVGISQDEVRDQVTASNVPDTPIIRIDAVGDSEEQAITLANISADELTKYVGEQAGKSPSGTEILRQYVKARKDLRQVEESGADPAEIAAAKLRVRSLAQSYQRSQEGVGLGNPVTVLNEATSASSDGRSKTLLFGITGLLAGLAVGSALAIAVGRLRFY